MRPSRFRGFLRASTFVTVTVLLIPVYLVSCRMGPAAQFVVRRSWCRMVSAILGIHLVRTGEVFRACPTLYVANHSSYLDIVCLGAQADATFIAKSEVAGWPFFGHLARLTGTMFVRRHWRQALIQRNLLADRLRTGENFVLFGEGTSTNGLDVKPFKTSLLSVAEPWVMDRPIAVQPVTIVYLRLRDGRPIDPSNTDLYAWWGSAEMLSHLWRMMKQPGVLIEIHFGTPVLSWAVTSRKVLGRELRAEVRHRLRTRRGLAPAEPSEAEQMAPFFLNTDRV
jgi:lyso-ornithine lipid O-acyltransferase